VVVLQAVTVFIEPLNRHHAVWKIIEGCKGWRIKRSGTIGYKQRSGIIAGIFGDRERKGKKLLCCFFAVSLLFFESFVLLFVETVLPRGVSVRT
jgi:hypothetical protein